MRARKVNCAGRSEDGQVEWNEKCGWMDGWMEWKGWNGCACKDASEKESERVSVRGRGRE